MFDFLGGFLLVGFLLMAGGLLLGFFVEEIRKAVGLMLVVLGIIECLTIVGLVLGLPTVLVGGLLLFLEDKKVKK